MSDIHKRKKFKELLEIYKYDIAVAKQQAAWKDEDFEENYKLLTTFHYQKQISKLTEEFLKDNEMSMVGFGMIAASHAVLFANILKLSEDVHNKELREKVLNKFLSVLDDEEKE